MSFRFPEDLALAISVTLSPFMSSCMLPTLVILTLLFLQQAKLLSMESLCICSSFNLDGSVPIIFEVISFAWRHDLVTFEREIC